MSTDTHDLKYRLADRPPVAVTLLSSLQWVGFVIACNAMVPLVVGDAFGFSAPQVAALTQRVFLVIALVSLLQVVRGHGWPISEGVSYVWLGVFVALAGVERAAGHDPLLILPKLEGGLIAAGAVLAGLSLLGLSGALQRLFTPVVVATYLILLPIQFSGPFLRSMTGASLAGSHGLVDLRVTAVSLAAIIATLGSSLFGRGAWRSLSSLLGFAVGLFAWRLAGLPLGAGAAAKGTGTTGWLLVWGPPQWDAGFIITSVLTSFLLLSNVFASLISTEQAIVEPPPDGIARRATLVNGLGTILTGLTSSIGLIPVASSAGFIRLTGVAARLPFTLSCVILAAMAFWPPAAHLIALLPLPLAYAVTFAAFNEMFSLGVLRLRQSALTRGNLAALSLSVFIGCGLMFLPPAALSGMPPVLRNLLGNGLLTGALLSLLLEHLVFRGLPTPA
ncbi:MAG: purine/pyrimidine permease [Chitinophagales bacterium]